jgi:hypothetical protein
MLKLARSDQGGLRQFDFALGRMRRALTPMVQSVTEACFADSTTS